MTVPVSPILPPTNGINASAFSMAALPQAYALRPDLVSQAAGASAGTGGVSASAGGGIPATTNGHSLAEMQKVSKQFEAIFLRMMLKEMRATIEKSGLSGNSRAMQLFESMKDDQTADALSTQGIGIGNMVYQQLTSSLLNQQNTSGNP